MMGMTDKPQFSDSIKARARWLKYKLLKKHRSRTVGCFGGLLFWTLSLSVTIISMTLTNQQHENRLQGVSEVNGRTEDSYMYPVQFDSSTTESVTLTLLTNTTNDIVQAFEEDCITIRPTKLSQPNQMIVDSGDSPHRSVNYYREKPLYALNNSIITYTVTARSNSSGSNSTGNVCNYLYLFHDEDDYREFIENTSTQGYFNKSECIMNNETQQVLSFKMNDTDGKVYVAIDMTGSEVVTYNITGNVLNYDTSKCGQRVHQLTYKQPEQITLCYRKIVCAFYPNEMIILIKSKEAVHIHWDVHPVQMSLVVWICIFIFVIIAISVLLPVAIALIVLICRKVLRRKNEEERTSSVEDTSTTPILSPSDTNENRGTDSRLTKENDLKVATQQLKRVLDRNHTELSTCFQAKLSQIAENLRQKSLITRDMCKQPCFDEIIDTFQGVIGFCCDKEEATKKCNDFCEAIHQVDEDLAEKFNKIFCALTDKKINLAD